MYGKVDSENVSSSDQSRLNRCLVIGLDAASATMLVRVILTQHGPCGGIPTSFSWLAIEWIDRLYEVSIFAVDAAVTSRSAFLLVAILDG